MLIHEVARISGMSRDGVRHYEELGLIRSSPRQAGSRTYREYEPAVLETIERVHQAQRLGFTLKEIAPLLQAYGNAQLPVEETVAFLHDRLAAIRQKQDELAKVELFIREKIKRYEAASRAGVCKKAPADPMLPMVRARSSKLNDGAARDRVRGAVMDGSPFLLPRGHIDRLCHSPHRRAIPFTIRDG